MTKRWITDRAEMETILHECSVGSLATIGPDGAPYVVTVNHVYHDGKIYFHGALKGTKMDNIAHDSRVCFETHVVDRIFRAPRAMEFGTRYRSVIVHGRAHQVIEPAAKMEALMALTNKYAGGYPFEPPTEQDVAATAVVAIEVDEMTGKKNVDF
jgi:nitroimidazol reductase NimA-like FMN-containing flavoprotein (pyridoxamine 5'-phosphate oxidase superfamily)